jgi:signal transduction histidine kinase
LVLFRVLQEGLTNVHKHSGSSTAVVRLTRSPDLAMLELTDQGNGFPVEILRGPRIDSYSFHGVGLRGMTERLRQLRGELYVTSSANGTQLRAMVPLGNHTDTKQPIL